MKHTPRHHSISWFQEHYKSGRLVLRPSFQRKPVWSDKQRSALIESVLIDVPIPEVYIQVTQDEDGTEQYGVVDGQQRLRTILQFIGLERPEDQKDGDDVNNFSLDQLPPTSPHRGKSFADITGESRRAFYQYEISARLLYTESLKEVEDIFKRLNKFLMPLKPQELRNATFHGPFAKLSELLANDEYWAVNKIVSPATIRRMGDIEMMSDLLIGLMHGPQGGSSKIIDQYYEQYESDEDEFPEQKRTVHIFGKTKTTIERLFPEIIDTRWGNRADFYSLFVAMGALFQKRELLKSKEKMFRETLSVFADEVDRRLESPTAKTSSQAQVYARAIEKGSNDKARRVDRHESLLEAMTPFFMEKK